MQVLTPFEFVEMFPEGQSVAIVGNSGSALERQNGRLIDDHDIVVRFNECAVDGYRSSIGQRTSILACNPYAETRSRQLLDGRRPDAVLCIASQTRRGDIEIFRDWVGSNRVLFTYSPDMIGVEDSTHRAGFTTGTYTLQLLSRVLRPSKMFLTGFTMFSPSDSMHYWTSQTASGVRAHDTEREAEVFVRILNSVKCPVSVTPDVQSMIQRTEVDAARHIQICPGRAA